jgi:hypothetical protein
MQPARERQARMRARMEVGMGMQIQRQTMTGTGQTETETGVPRVWSADTGMAQKVPARCLSHACDNTTISYLMILRAILPLSNPCHAQCLVVCTISCYDIAYWYSDGQNVSLRWLLSMIILLLRSYITTACIKAVYLTCTAALNHSSLQTTWLSVCMLVWLSARGAVLLHTYRWRQAARHAISYASKAPHSHVTSCTSCAWKWVHPQQKCKCPVTAYAKVAWVSAVQRMYVACTADAGKKNLQCMSAVALLTHAQVLAMPRACWTSSRHLPHPHHPRDSAKQHHSPLLALTVWQSRVMSLFWYVCNLSHMHDTFLLLIRINSAFNILFRFFWSKKTKLYQTL